ncbi:hypothetical protein Ddye_021250 [Dipteronia dyeriana]|uniref:Uncharacterized protein n=1 Tax=Dipteronia dyeriana TaxID=168575 RepID=A0AAD9U186_9ROSI|nr:hypothetical protein Ddye_021250 [Dipteronia dyeriana]
MVLGLIEAGGLVLMVLGLVVNGRFGVDNDGEAGGFGFVKLVVWMPSLCLDNIRNKLKDFLKTPEGDWYEEKLTRHNHFNALDRIDGALDRVYEDFSIEDRHRFTASCFGVVQNTNLYVVVENDIHQRYFSGADEILMGLDERFKILVWQFWLVEDLAAFDAFPWGVHVYTHSICHSSMRYPDDVRDANNHRALMYIRWRRTTLRSISCPIGKNSE